MYCVYDIYKIKDNLNKFFLNGCFYLLSYYVVFFFKTLQREYNKIIICIEKHNIVRRWNKIIESHFKKNILNFNLIFEKDILFCY